jgi:hypothetical protein
VERALRVAAEEERAEVRPRFVLRPSTYGAASSFATIPSQPFAFASSYAAIPSSGSRRDGKSPLFPDLPTISSSRARRTWSGFSRRSRPSTNRQSNTM